MLASVCILAVFCGSPMTADAKLEELLDAAQKALAGGRAKDAVALAGKAILAEPKNHRAYYLRGLAYETLEQHSEAVADFTKVVELDAKVADAYNRRGSEYFKLGQVAKSIADFDKFLELRPEQTPAHWKRGISYYYAGRYDDGRKQFEGYESVDTNDVENAVWRYLCMAKTSGVDKARAALLKIGLDKRVPMMEVYALFAGKAKPDEVLAAAQAGKPAKEQLNRHLFYAHLYLGLFHEVNGDAKLAREHLHRATEHRFEHYMWDVARVHHDLLKKK